MKPIKPLAKLVIKCFLVLLPLWLVWGYIWKFPLDYVDEEIPYYVYFKNLINRQSIQEYDVLILGDSAGNSAFEPEYMSERVLNLALGGATPAETYYILCNYLRNHPKPKVCYITFMDFHLNMQDVLFKRTFYSRLLSWREDFDILQQAELYEEKSIIGPTTYKDWLSYRLRLPNKYLPALMNSGFNGRLMTNDKAINLVEMHRGTYISRGVNEDIDFQVAHFDDYKTAPFFDAYYKKILQKCYDEGINVRIIMSPVSQKVLRTDAYQESVHEYYNDLKQEFPNVTFLDRMDNFDWRYLQDAWHMNIHGALKFSKTIKRLYPEDFAEAENDLVSRRTIDGMVDYLNMENYPGEIFRRIENTDFSAVVIRWPGRGGNDEDVLAATDECFPLMNEQIKPLVAESEKDAAAFFVNGLSKQCQTECNGKDFIFTDSRMQKPVLLKLDGCTAGLYLPWQKDPVIIEPKMVVDMTVVILNHYDNTIVAIKHFVFSHGGYRLI